MLVHSVHPLQGIWRAQGAGFPSGEQQAAFMSTLLIK